LIQAGFAGRNSGNIADCGFGALACAGPEMPNPVRGDFGHGERVPLKPAVRQRQKGVNSRPLSTAPGQYLKAGSKSRALRPICFATPAALHSPTSLTLR
jgi:hypothetical protein